jgi:hypothetical protein
MPEERSPMPIGVPLAFFLERISDGNGVVAAVTMDAKAKLVSS